MSESRYLSHHDVVRRLVESKAVDFEAIGKTVAELGPSLVLGDEPWDNFCWTMRTFIRIYRTNGPRLPLEGLRGLGNLAGELQGPG